MVNVKIHRGTGQIGGTITEIYTENTHLFIDFGSELTVNPEESTDGRMINMIKNAECDAVLFSHYHGDHVGLLEHIPQKDIRGEEIKLGIGKVARQVLANIQKTLAGDSSRPEEQNVHRKMLYLLQDNNRWIDFTDALTMGNEQSSSFDVGDFHITTIRVDHSAYDSYMFVIETEGKCIVHTGDFRVHGRLGDGFFNQLRKFMADKKVDVLLIEGTMLGRLDEKVMKEEGLLQVAEELLKKPENKYAYLICSSTNMESLASFYKAVLFSNKAKEKAGDKDYKRAMYVNRYVKQQMDLFASAEPDITWEFRKAYPFEQQGKHNKTLGMSQMKYMEENGFLILLGKSDSYQKYIEPFKDKDPLLIYSMWNGYVDDENSDTYDEKWGALYKSFKRKKKLHTSGHAVKKDLEEMIAIVNPQQAIVPIHTEFKESYDMLEGVGNLVKCLDDGEIYSLYDEREMEKADMISWGEYIEELIKEINSIENAVVVGITGSYKDNLKKDDGWGFKRAAKCWKLRVYINGGYVMGIPLEEHDFEFASDSYIDEKYLDDSEQSEIEEIKKAIWKDKYAWRKDNYRLLKEYLNYMENATKNKFGSLKNMDTQKERMYQIKFFKKLLKDVSKEYAFMDVELQTVAEMNYTEEELIEKKEKGEVLHRAKPDYVAIDKDGFLLIELKTNKAALKGKAGIVEHERDFNKLIEINKENLYLVEELKQRLKVMYEKHLLNDAYRELAEKILNTDTKELRIRDRYMFIVNAELTEAECKDYIREYKIPMNKVIFEME